MYIYSENEEISFWLWEKGSFYRFISTFFSSLHIILTISFYLLKSKHINCRISILDLKSNGNGSKTVCILHIDNGVAVCGLRFNHISYRTCRHFAHDSHFVSYNWVHAWPDRWDNSASAFYVLCVVCCKNTNETTHRTTWITL